MIYQQSPKLKTKSVDYDSYWEREQAVWEWDSPMPLEEARPDPDV